ncbi:MAG: hypothetical protein JJW01_03335, partial [Alphaproteobacteria bacterium]|nr:hypothetical protein [Rickettsiales bacterium]
MSLADNKSKKKISRRKNNKSVKSSKTNSSTKKVNVNDSGLDDNVSSNIVLKSANTTNDDINNNSISALNCTTGIDEQDGDVSKKKKTILKQLTGLLKEARKKRYIT